MKEHWMNVLPGMIKYLKGKIMDSGIYSFSNIKINKSLLDEIWNFNPETLSSLDGITVSKYSLALAQYLIYYRNEVNKTKAIVVKKKKSLDASLSMSLDADMIKKFKTKSAAEDYLINTNSDLTTVSKEIEALEEELIKVDGIDKSISEYIATFKRELSRREQELFTIRAERRS